MGVGAAGAIFFTSRMFARPAPSTMNKEWQEATNEYLRVRWRNTISMSRNSAARKRPMLTCILNPPGKQGRANHLYRQPRLQGTRHGPEPTKEGVNRSIIDNLSIDGAENSRRERLTCKLRIRCIFLGLTVRRAGVFGASRTGQDFVSYTSAQRLSHCIKEQNEASILTPVQSLRDRLLG